MEFRERIFPPSQSVHWVEGMKFTAMWWPSWRDCIPLHDSVEYSIACTIKSLSIANNQENACDGEEPRN